MAICCFFLKRLFVKVGRQAKENLRKYVSKLIIPCPDQMKVMQSFNIKGAIKSKL